MAKPQGLLSPLERQTYESFGIAPREDRLSLLPRYSAKTGLIAPQFVYDAAKALAAPYTAAQGYDLPPEEAVNVGMNMMGGGAVGTAPKGALRSGISRDIKPVKPVSGLIEAAPDLSYRSTHEAPGPHFGAPLHDLTGGGQMYPADVYSPKAVQYYGTGFDKADQQAFAIANSVKGNPNAMVTMYRAVPKELSNSEKLAKIEKEMSAYMKRKTLPKDANTNDGSKWYDSAYEERERLRQLPDEPVKGISTINAGDWVTLTKDYAKQHGESVLNGKYKIISKKVKAKDLWTNADSIQEFGYNPSK